MMATIHATVDGIKIAVDENTMSDFRMLEPLYRMQNGDAAAAWGFAEMMFGREQLMRILGEMPATDIQSVTAFLKRAIDAIAEAKGENPKN